MYKQLIIWDYFLNMINKPKILFKDFPYQTAVVVCRSSPSRTFWILTLYRFFFLESLYNSEGSDIGKGMNSECFNISVDIAAVGNISKITVASTRQRSKETQLIFSTKMKKGESGQDMGLTAWGLHQCNLINICWESTLY